MTSFRGNPVVHRGPLRGEPVEVVDPPERRGPDPRVTTLPPSFAAAAAAMRGPSDLPTNHPLKEGALVKEGALERLYGPRRPTRIRGRRATR
jgi:hypothetical protein